MNADHITATTAIEHMSPLTMIAYIRDLANAPDTLPQQRADLLRATLDALSINVGAQNAIALLAAADVCAEHPIVADIVDAWVQPAFFPSGEDTPLFTQPAEPEPDDQHLNCSRCNRHPAESGLARWQGCDVCGAPVCDTCAWQTNDGVYCSHRCMADSAPY
jgi:hypothetical protein